MDWEQFKIPVGDWPEAAVDWLTEHGGWFFDGLAAVVTAIIDAILWALQTPPALVVVAVFAALAWFLQRSWWTVGARGPRLPLHPEPGLLGGDDRDADAGALGGHRLHGARRADRHRRGAPAEALRRRCGRCST